MKRRRLGGLVALVAAMTAFLVSGYASPAHAVLALVSRNPDATFLVHPGNGFPQWYQDTDGFALGQCNFGVFNDPVGFVQDPNCLPAGASARPLPNLPFDEAFYFTADSVGGALDGGAISGSLLVIALEAAFGTGDPSPGQQLVFARIRFRANVAAGGEGTYTLTHPYGVETFDVATTGTRAINFTRDIGLAPLGFNEAVVNGDIGPFLTCVNPAPPAGYLGNVGVPCTFTGGLNDLVSITGPLATNNTTTVLLIGGKIDPKLPFTPLTVDAATYRCSRAGTCQIDVFAHSSPAAALFATSGSFTGPQMTGDGAGGFFGTLQVAQTAIPFPPSAANPSLLVNVSAADPAGVPVSLKTRLVDSVNISQATHNLATGIISVRATSGDPRATITEVQFGSLKGGALDVDLNGFTAISIPHPTVTVVSNAGGSATVPVQILNVPEGLKIVAAKFNLRRKRLTVTGTSTAPGAALLLQTGVKQLGTAVVAANGAFTMKANLKRAPRFVKVLSSGGASVRKAVKAVTR